MKYKCIICGTKFEGGMYEDPCPRCQWIPIASEDVENEDERDYVNRISVREAKKRYAKGLDRFGDPIKN